MSTRSALLVTAWVLPALLIITHASLADDRCTLSAPLNGAYPVDIDGKKYLAIPRATALEATQCRSTLADLEQKLTQEKNLRANLENVVVPALQTNIRLKEEHIATQNAQLQDLKSSKAKLEAMLGLGDRPVFTYEAGIGIVRTRDTLQDDNKAAALLGIGYRRWRLWGYAQDGATGVLMGREF